MHVPGVVDWPEFVRWNELLQTLERWDLLVVSLLDDRPAGCRVFCAKPVRRRPPAIRSFHVDAVPSVPAWAPRERGDGVHYRVLPVRLGDNFAVLLAHRLRRPSIPSVRPEERRSVRPQHQDLRTKALGGHAMILLAPLVPLFTLVAAHPTENHWDPLLVGEFDDVLARDLRFPAEHVNAEILHVAQDLRYVKD